MILIVCESIGWLLFLVICFLVVSFWISLGKWCLVCENSVWLKFFIVFFGFFKFLIKLSGFI